MKQKIPVPVAITVVVVFLGGFSFILWKHFLAPPPDDKPFSPTRSKPATPPVKKEREMDRFRFGR